MALLRVTPRCPSGWRPGALGLAFFAAAACANETGAVATAKVEDSGKKPASAICQGPGYAGPGAPVPFSHLSATVLGLDGKAAARVPAQACGINLCLNGTTSDQGDVSIDETGDIVRPAFKYGGGTLYAKLALPLGDAGPIHVDLGPQTTVSFDPPAAGAPLSPGKEATSRGVMVSIAEGATVDVDPFDYDTPDLRKLRAAEIPVAEAPKVVDATLGFGLLIALTPSGARFCPAAKLRAPNSPGWPAGSRIEVFVHGVEVDEEWAPYGGWAKVSDGSVSADGATLETDDAGGLPLLSLVGVRLLP